MIASKDIGLVLRILGQNPTEDQIVEMVMKVSATYCGDGQESAEDDFKFHVQTRVLGCLVYKK